MSKKYQIFISSTYADLKDERQRAVEAVLESGHIPAGMELFRAGDRGQWEVIKNWINDSDIFLIIIGGRYGTVDKATGKSYTQMEYEYARQMDKPMIRVVLSDDYLQNKKFEAESTELQQKRKEFCNMVTEKKMSYYVDDLGDIGRVLGRDLDEIIEDERLQNRGWVRNGHSTGEDFLGDDIFHNQKVPKYELIKYLFFAEDDGMPGLNRFNVLPKVLMLMDVIGKKNHVDMHNLWIEYSIYEGEKKQGKNGEIRQTYDSVRNWRMSGIRNCGEEPIGQFYFYTGTDIGKRQAPEVRLQTGIREVQRMVEHHSYNGISVLSWNILPRREKDEVLDDMVMSEEIRDAWNFSHNEIIYFTPENFAERIGNIVFRIDVASTVPDLQMTLYEVAYDNGEVSRSEIGILNRTRIERGYCYSRKINNEDVHMDSIYYIVIENIEINS